MTPDEANAALKEVLLAEIKRLDDLITEKGARYAELVNTKTDAVATLLKEKDALYTDRDTARQKAVEAALKAAQTGVDAAFAASEKAIGKSDQNAEKWRENANEWRAAMQDREVKFAGRIEVDNELKNLRTELASVKEGQDRKSGKGEGLNAAWLVLVAAIGIVLSGLFLYEGTKSTAQPQVIYVPSPPGTLIPSTPPNPPVPR